VIPAVTVWYGRDKEQDDPDEDEDQADRKTKQQHYDQADQD